MALIDSTELRDRLESAQRELLALHEGTPVAAFERRTRLSCKIGGLKLALSYLDDAERTAPALPPPRPLAPTADAIEAALQGTDWTVVYDSGDGIRARVRRSPVNGSIEAVVEGDVLFALGLTREPSTEPAGRREV